MNILYAPAHYEIDEDKLGSESSWVLNIISRLAQKEIKVKAITGYHNVTPKSEYLQFIDVYKDIKADKALLDRGLFNYRYFKAAKKIVSTEQINIIHHMFPFKIGVSYNLLAVFNQLDNKPFVIGPLQTPFKTIYRDELAPAQGGTPLRKIQKTGELTAIKGVSKILNLLSFQTIKKADRLIVLDETTRDFIKKNIGNNIADKIQIIPPGINLKDFPSKSKPIKKDSIELITIGRVTKRKRIDLIMKAVFFIKKEQKINITLRIIGDGAEIDGLKGYRDKLDLKNNVIFEGFIPNKKLSKYYAQADIYCSMSEEETFGQVYLESMACGIPIIASETIGASEIIKDGVTGFLVPQEDYNTLAKKIITLIRNNELHYQFTNKARKRVEQKYDWDKVIVPKYINLYQSLI